MTLSDTQSSILQQADQRIDRLVVPPERLPPGPRVSIAHALLNAGLVARTDESDTSAGWKLDGEVIWLSITDAGRQAISEVSEDPASASGVAPASLAEAGTAADGLPTETRPSPPCPRHPPSLQEAATVLLDRWDSSTEREPLVDAVAALRAVNLKPAPRKPRTACAPRQGTKQDAVLTLLRRPESATIANVVEATGWAQHTVRGFFAGLKKKGHTVEVLDRVHKNGPGSAGAKGSYSIYRLGEAG